VKQVKFLCVVVFSGMLAWAVYALNHRPILDAYDALWLPPADGATGQVRITSLGVSTLLIDDGESAFMVDGFFSRPGLFKVAATRLSPDHGRIAAGLKRVGVEQLMAVLVVHSHYDHVMDAPEVARRTGALLVGSTSTANVGRGAGLPEDRIVAVEGDAAMRFGKFVVTMVKSRHFPHGKAMGEISEPLEVPARAMAYQEGGSYSIHVAHESGSLLIQGSAGYIEGALANMPADVALLGIGLLGSKDQQYMHSYWHETVQAVGARRVIPIHWDDFFKPLEERPRPFAYLLDDFDASMQFILNRAAKEKVDVRLAPAWQSIDPFEGLKKR
jgi:L-ascorbate metabolism protein UlaG (beta-lactamase superfamily)